MARATPTEPLLIWLFGGHATGKSWLCRRLSQLVPRCHVIGNANGADAALSTGHILTALGARQPFTILATYKVTLPMVRAARKSWRWAAVPILLAPPVQLQLSRLAMRRADTTVSALELNNSNRRAVTGHALAEQLFGPGWVVTDGDGEALAHRILRLAPTVFYDFAFGEINSGAK